MHFTQEDFMQFETEQFVLHEFKPWDQERMKVSFTYFYKGMSLKIEFYLRFRSETILYLHIHKQTDLHQAMERMNLVAAYIENTCKEEKAYRLKFLIGEMEFETSYYTNNLLHRKRMKRIKKTIFLLCSLVAISAVGVLGTMALKVVMGAFFILSNLLFVVGGSKFYSSGNEYDTIQGKGMISTGFLGITLSLLLIWTLSKM